MHPSSHLIVSWLVGQHLSERRDHLLVAYAGVAPDLDGLSLLGGVDAYGQWPETAAFLGCSERTLLENVYQLSESLTRALRETFTIFTGMVR